MPAKVQGWPPRWLTATTPAERKRGDGGNAGWFIENCCRIHKDSIAGRSGELMSLRAWQQNLLTGLFARRSDGRLRHRQALIGVARKNGKSALGAGIALYGLFGGAGGSEVYSCAGDREQARIVFGAGKRMVELDPELAAASKTYRDAIEVPATGSVWRVLSAEAYTKEGLSPTLTVFDEVHVQPNDELWNVMSLGMGARVDPLMVGITTAGARTDSLGQDTLCYRLYQYGRRLAAGEIDDPSFFFAWWEPKAGTEANHRDPKVWFEANPGLGDIVDREDFESSLLRTPEAEYRTKRTNVFVTAGGSALPHGAWEAKARPRDAAQGSVLVVDGSWNGDCTGIVGCSPAGHLFKVAVWERPLDNPHWRVPISEVKARVAEEAKALASPAVAFDPFRWQAVMQELESEGIPILEFPNSVARMVPAWTEFYAAVMDEDGLTHDGDPTLTRHVENMRLKLDEKGARPVKESKMSGRHIDLGICAVIAYSLRALTRPAPAVPLVAWR